MGAGFCSLFSEIHYYFEIRVYTKNWRPKCWASLPIVALYIFALRILDKTTPHYWTAYLDLEAWSVFEFIQVNIEGAEVNISRIWAKFWFEIKCNFLDMR